MPHVDSHASVTIRRTTSAPSFQAFTSKFYSLAESNCTTFMVNRKEPQPPCDMKHACNAVQVLRERESVRRVPHLQSAIHRPNRPLDKRPRNTEMMRNQAASLPDSYEPCAKNFFGCAPDLGGPRIIGGHYQRHRREIIEPASANPKS